MINLFAAVQKGNGNTMSFAIEGRGNQFVALQLGDNNAAVMESGGCSGAFPVLIESEREI